MLHRPKNRSCPSCSASSRWKVLRQPPGEMNGKRPSSTSTRASADQKMSLSKPGGPYFFAGAAAAPELPRKALKNSEPAGSTTSTSPFLLKLAL
jgi:hypothetical protein